MNDFKTGPGSNEGVELYVLANTDGGFKGRITPGQIYRAVHKATAAGSIYIIPDELDITSLEDSSRKGYLMVPGEYELSKRERYTNQFGPNTSPAAATVSSEEKRRVLESMVEESLRKLLHSELKVTLHVANGLHNGLTASLIYEGRIISNSLMVDIS